MNFILIVFTFLLYGFIRNKRNAINRFLTIETIVLVVVSGLRHPSVGNDTYNYLYLLKDSRYDNIDGLLSSFFDGFMSTEYTFRDPGYWLFQTLFAKITTEQIPFLLTIAVITLVPFACFNKRFLHKLNYILFSYVLFICLLYSNFPNQFVRQCCAFSFMCIGYISLSNNKNLKFIILTLIASTFHKSALILIVFYVIYKYIPAKYYLLLGYIGFFTLLFVPTLAITLMGDVGEIYVGYFNVETDKSVIIVFFLAFLYLMVTHLILSKQFSIQENKLQLCGVCVLFMLTPSIYIASTAFRIISYFLVWDCVLIPQIIDKYSQKKVLLVALYIILLYKSYPRNNDFRYFYWEDLKLHDMYTKLDVCDKCIKKDYININNMVCYATQNINYYNNVQ